MSWKKMLMAVAAVAIVAAAFAPTEASARWRGGGGYGYGGAGFGLGLGLAGAGITAATAPMAMAPVPMPTAAVDAGGASSFAHHMGLALVASGSATRTSSADRLGNIARRRHPHYVQKRTLRKPAIKSAICQQRTHHCFLITPEAV